MDAKAVLGDAVGRIPEMTKATLDGLTDEQLTWLPDPGANSISWLLWHLARQADAQVSELAGTEQVWTADGWAERAALDLPDDATGYGMSAEDVAKVRVTADLLQGYVEATYAFVDRYVQSLADGDLDDVVDDAWDPPVTRGVRLVSVVDDAAQHVGQAGYVRGLLERTA